MKIVGIIVISGGVWMFQDGLASILYYLHKDGEKWYYNHALRIARMAWGVALVICGWLCL